VPGRKTDINDAMWLAELLAHGLIRASFVPDAQTQEMRNLLRTRKQLVREQSSHVLRVQKTLEDANIKLDSLPRHGDERRAASGARILAGSSLGCTEATLLASAPLRVIAHELVAVIKGNVSIDWWSLQPHARGEHRSRDTAAIEPSPRTVPRTRPWPLPRD